MKRSILHTIFPLTIISFALVTKWWYMAVVDGPDEVLLGFPFPFMCRGWHTSMSLQLFTAELVADLFVYFLFWFALVFLIRQLLPTRTLHAFLKIVLHALNALVICYTIFILAMPDNMLLLRRDFEIQVKTTGYKLFGQDVVLPDGHRYPVSPL